MNSKTVRAVHVEADFDTLSAKYGAEAAQDFFETFGNDPDSPVDLCSAEELTSISGILREDGFDELSDDLDALIEQYQQNEYFIFQF